MQANLAKSEIGVVSKAILDGVIGPMRSSVRKNLWQNTPAVIDWFEGIEDKPRYTFVMFEIVEVYPSITKDLLLDALSYAGTHLPISKKDIVIETILHARKSLLFDGGKAWMKKEKDGSFNVTLG